MNSIVSQTTPDSSIDNPFGENEPEWFDNERLVKYREINEMYKYAKAYEESVKLDSTQQGQIQYQDSIIQAQAEIISRYETRIIPNLESQVLNLEGQVGLLRQKEEAYNELSAIREERWEVEMKALKSRRLGLGLYAGYGANLQNLSGTVELQPSVGISIHYTLIRF